MTDRAPWLKPDYPAIRAAALALAERYHGTPLYRSRRKSLLHIAKDCQAAMDGCPASAESVAEFLAGDHELEMATAAMSTVPMGRAA